MVVGILRVVLQLQGVRSLKEKRMRIRPLLDRTRQRFNAAVAEVRFQDDWQRAEIGVCVVSSDKGHANSMLDTIVAEFEGERISERHVEFVHVGEDHGGGESVLGSWDQFDE